MEKSPLECGWIVQGSTGDCGCQRFNGKAGDGGRYSVDRYAGGIPCFGIKELEIINYQLSIVNFEKIERRVSGGDV